jgi:hypothetical protein
MTTKITDKNISSIANLFVSWQSVITADGSTTTTGVAGRGYFINTTSAAHTFTLPTIATAGDTISIKDYAGTFASNKLTIDRNGHNIQGSANNSLIGTNRASVTLVYIDVTRGWEFVKESNVANLEAPVFTSATGGTITTSGNFKIHSFTGDGCFVVSSLGNSPTVPTGGPSNVDYLVVAGGGAAGYGGGGAGGYRTTFPSPACNAGSFPISATTYSITVGAGGTGAASSPAAATPGSPSIFSTITSAGGGRGGNNGSCSENGGSGGGASSCGSGPRVRGLGNTPPVSPPQGNDGGLNGSSAATYPSGGGGGAGVVGSAGSPTGASSGPGGAGLTNSITGSPLTYAGGGGGANWAGAAPTAGTGGSGGGGTGGGSNINGTSGTSNTGGGGGGSGGPAGVGGSGGSGIVIIRYKFQ